MKAKLLIVGHEAIVPGLRHTLRLDPRFDVESADTEAAAKTSILAWQPDILFVDEPTAGKDGMRLLQQAAATCPGSVRVLMTSTLDFAKVQAASEAKVTQLLAKPFRTPDFLACLQTALDSLLGKRECSIAHRPCDIHWRDSLGSDLMGVDSRRQERQFSRI